MDIPGKQDGPLLFDPIRDLLGGGYNETHAEYKLFNLSIVEVISAAYCLRFPDTIYSRKWKFLPLIEY